MNHQVEGDRNPRDGGQTNELGVAEESRGTVVVSVEEGQGLLLEEEEDGVDQLEVLGEVVELDPASQCVFTSDLFFAAIKHT